MKKALLAAGLLSSVVCLGVLVKTGKVDILESKVKSIKKYIDTDLSEKMKSSKEVQWIRSELETISKKLENGVLQGVSEQLDTLINYAEKVLSKV